ncbi:MAG TPA: DNA recombination protein RmuC [Thermoguttaceae bacterium]
MNDIFYIITFLVGIGLGALAIWLILRGKIRQAFDQGRNENSTAMAALSERLTGREASIEELKNHLQQRDTSLHELQSQITALSTRGAQLETALKEERRQNEEKLALLDEAKQKFSDAFKALASDALKSSNTSFLELAKTQLEKFHESAKGDLEKRQTAIDELVKPVKESLGKVDAKLQEIEKARIEAYSGLTEQVKSMQIAQSQLISETSNLVKALRSPQTRGRWGEIQLRRVVEMAGMLEHCDFTEQETVAAEDNRLRPDMIIHLPGKKRIVVDAKTPLAAYLDAVETQDDETRTLKLQDHARQVREHVLSLSKKSYYDQFDTAPDFVVLFLPGEVFLSAAWEYDPTLIEFAIERNVMLTTPTTLISLLRAVAYGWRQELLAENAQKISNLGRELYDRIANLSKHFDELGKGLSSAIEAYNKAIGSLESRVLVSARKFKELGAADTSKEIGDLEPIETDSRLLQAPEMLLKDDRQE